MRIAILYAQRPGGVDAIRDASSLLADALRAAGAGAEVRLRRPDGSWARADGSPVRAPLAETDAVVLAYNPFSWARWGFAPWLAAEIARARLRRARPRLAVLVHEPYVPIGDWRTALMGAWQRAQLAVLLAAADVVFVSIEAWTRRLGRLRPRRPTLHLPSGSNLPDRRDAREAERARLGVTPGDLVVATLGSDHPSHLSEPVVAALRALADRDGRLLLLRLGAGVRAPDGLPDLVEPVVPGPLPTEELAGRLSAADLFLAPFVDGVSTRRTSVMAALQHGLAVVATDGPLTDGELRRSGALRLAPVHAPERFAAEVLRLAERPDERAALGSAARALYEERYDWPVVARRVLEAVR